ncbi:MAG: hypothetical protein JO279_09510 [Verrucomicrobia bacterium]|nr:hypothetical protein [Verrucomicrobiota bacterium]
MKKHLFLLYAFYATFLVASPTFAENPFATPPPAPASINIYDWYNLGEYLEASSQLNFNFSVADQMDDTYKHVYDLMVKAHVSDGTINAFKQWYVVLRALPWDKAWNTWTKEQQNAWRNSPLPGAWYKGVAENASHAVESMFFYWLGEHTLAVAWAVPYYLSQGWTKDATDEIVSAAKDFAYFSTNADYNPVFSALTPDVQKAITFIASAKKKVAIVGGDPFQKSTGLSSDDIAKIVDVAKAIRAAAQANQLTQ